MSQSPEYINVPAFIEDGKQKFRHNLDISIAKAWKVVIFIRRETDYIFTKNVILLKPSDNGSVRAYICNRQSIPKEITGDCNGSAMSLSIKENKRNPIKETSITLWPLPNCHLLKAEK